MLGSANLIGCCGPMNEHVRKSGCFEIYVIEVYV